MHGEDGECGRVLLRFTSAAEAKYKGYDEPYWQERPRILLNYGSSYGLFNDQYIYAHLLGIVTCKNDILEAPEQPRLP